MEKLITNLQQTYWTRNSYYMMSIINQFREKAPDLCINYFGFSKNTEGNPTLALFPYRDAEWQAFRSPQRPTGHVFKHMVAVMAAGHDMCKAVTALLYSCL